MADLMNVEVRDVVSGFSGTVIARAEYQYEGSQVLVVAQTSQAPADARWIAESRVVPVDAKAPGFA